MYGDPYRAAHRLLDEIVSVAGEMGLTLPTRRLVSSGEAVYDCEMLSVSAQSVTPGTALAESTWSTICDTPHTTQLESAIVRSARERPDGRQGELPPKAEWLDSDLQHASVDSYLFLTAARRLQSTIETDLALQGISLVGTQGGFNAVVMIVGVTLLDEEI